MLVVNEREEGAVVLHLPFGPLTTTTALSGLSV